MAGNPNSTLGGKGVDEVHWRDRELVNPADFALGDALKSTILAATALVLVQSASVLADDDKERYNRRAAQTDMSLFRELDRGGNGP